ncbi:MAG: DNA-packaging protein [Caulobacterales bacterium RIFOXYB1_FULL_67_16]|nr:MAG: DNA-packaging protein [Caulobacterales bacterium RIFOXYB1_FULL_67_16]
MFLGGRGAGKTLAGASWAADEAERLGPGGRLALVGPTLHDVREVMIGGPSGILALPRWGRGMRPVYEPTRRRLVFPNGAEARAFSAEDPDSLRGPQFAGAWADEFCAWARPDETLAMLRLGLRLGRDPRLVVTTTPRPMAGLKALRAEAGCVTTHAPTRDNAENLAPGVIARLEDLYGGTRRAAQELEGLILDTEGALFRAEDIERANRREEPAPERFERVVVAIDPTTTPGGDACGIVAAGRAEGRAWVLADRSMRGLSPDGWARRALACAAEFGAGAIVAEVNQGGDMVAHVLRTLDPAVVVREVRATRGKRMRAEPVAALYEQGRVTHLGRFRDLEEELMALGGDETGSLDRADALVWALTDLMLGEEGPGPWFRVL